MVDIFYRNNLGQEIHFNSHPYYLNRATDLFSHKWDYINSEYASKIDDFKMTFVEKSFDIGVVAKSYREYNTALTEINNVFDSDVRSLTPGRLYCGNDYLNCYIVACNLNTFDTRVNKVVKPYKLLAENGEWIREDNYSTIRRLISSDEGIDFEYDFEYDYAYSDDVDYVNNTSVAGADFIMTIYGATTLPEVTIGDNVYAVKTEISESMRIVINSIERTVTQYDAYNRPTNVFNLRDREHDIFAKIPVGKHKINRNGTFHVVLTVYNYRSEPEWWKE